MIPHRPIYYIFIELHMWLNFLTEEIFKSIDDIRFLTFSSIKAFFIFSSDFIHFLISILIAPLDFNVILFKILILFSVSFNKSLSDKFPES